MAIGIPNFTIEGRMKTLPDVQRNWMWQVWIPGIKTVAPTTAGFGTEDLIIRARTVSIPQRDNEPTTSNFMGMKQHFAGKPVVDGQVAVTFEETEDMKIAKIFYEWQQMIFNTHPVDIRGGSSKRSGQKRGRFGIGGGYALPMYIIMYGYNGKRLDKAIKFNNAWIKTVAEVSMDYASGDSIKYNTTFQYDFWQLVDSRSLRELPLP